MLQASPANLSRDVLAGVVVFLEDAVSKSTGRRYEREVISILEHRGWIVDDVSPNAGVYSGHECDLLVTPPSIDVDVFSSDEIADNTFRAEVKYRKSGSGMKRLYTQLMESCGIGTVERIEFSNGLCAGGIVALEAWHSDLGERFEIDDPLDIKSVDDWLYPEDMPSRDILLFRGSSRHLVTGKWLAVWRT